MWRPCAVVLGAWIAGASIASAGFWGFEEAQSAYFGHLWEAPMVPGDQASYDQAVEDLIAAFEKATGRALQPGEKGQVALKINTASGPGLSTPKPLVLAVAKALEARGFQRENLMLVDAREGYLREAGYLPPLSARDTSRRFAGMKVIVLDEGVETDPQWFYESALPREINSPLARPQPVPDPIGSDLLGDWGQGRVSYLAKTLLFDVDFWINLPVVTDHPALGLNGSLVNASLWGITNRERFMQSPANGPVAVAEIAAIPEWRSNLAFTILSLELYQYIGGPAFYSLYTHGESRLWLSVDPVIPDALILPRLNALREKQGFPPIPEALPYLDYAVELGIGYGAALQARVDSLSRR